MTKYNLFLQQFTATDMLCEYFVYNPETHGSD